MPALDSYDLDHSDFWRVDDSSLSTERIVDHSVDGDDSEMSVPSVRSATTSFTDLMHHLAVSDLFIPTITRWLDESH